MAEPIVVLAIDWCEIRNDAYERWREVLAEAAGTDTERVLVTALHQHDAPIADLEAQRMLETREGQGQDLLTRFSRESGAARGQALRQSLKEPRTITHFGIGQAKVEKVASNRRYLGPDGKPRFNRMSAHARPEDSPTPRTGRSIPG